MTVSQWIAKVDPSAKRWDPVCTITPDSHTAATVGVYQETQSTPSSRGFSASQALEGDHLRYRPSKRMPSSTEEWDRFENAKTEGLKTSSGNMWQTSSARPQFTVTSSLSVRHIGVKTGWCGLPIINPSKSKTLTWWELFSGGTLALVCFLVPFEVAFVYDGSHLFVVNRIVDFIFMMDMILQFFVAYPVKSAFCQSVAYEFNQVKIARKYLKTWFVVDAVSIVPYDMIANALESSKYTQLKLLKIIRLFRLLKLARLLRDFRILDRLMLIFEFSQRKIMLVQLIVTVLLCSHWVSCVLGLTSRLQLDNTELCFSKDQQDCTITWMTGSHPDEKLHKPEEQYLIALHVAISVVVHPHALNTLRSSEIVVFIIMVLIGGYVWTRVISRSTSISTSLDRHTIFYQQSMDDVSAIASDFGMSSNLTRQLRAFFADTVDTSQRKTWEHLKSKMTTNLRSATAREINWPWIMHVDYLAKCTWELKTAVSEELRVESYAQREFFGKSFHMYILTRGLASKRMGSILSKGTVWGTDHLLLRSPHLLDEVECMAMTFVEIFSLSRLRWDSILRDHPENVTEVRRKLVKIAVMRGVRYLARQSRERKKQWEEILEGWQTTTLHRHQRNVLNKGEESEVVEKAEQLQDEKPKQKEGLTGNLDPNSADNQQVPVARPTVALGGLLDYAMESSSKSQPTKLCNYRKLSMQEEEEKEEEEEEEEGEESDSIFPSGAGSGKSEVVTHADVIMSGDSAAALKKLKAALKKTDGCIYNFSRSVDDRIDAFSISMESQISGVTFDATRLAKDVRAWRAPVKSEILRSHWALV